MISIIDWIDIKEIPYPPNKCSTLDSERIFILNEFGYIIISRYLYKLSCWESQIKHDEPKHAITHWAYIPVPI